MPQRPAPIGVLLGFVLLLLALPARADGKLEVIETFTRGSAQLSIGHYSEPGADKAKGKVGLIGIAAPARNSFAFSPAEWAKLIELCDKAIATRSAGWREVGAMQETGTEDAAQLTVSAGPGLSLVISSPKAGTVSYVVHRADLPRLKRGLIAVRDYLAK